jgi:putative membrane protein
VPEAKRGRGAHFASVMLPVTVPPGIAMEWLYTGRQIPVEEAARWGLVNRVAPAAELMKVAMALAADIAVALVALLHAYFLVLEMFLWDKPAGLRAFGHSAEAAASSKVLAANQGLYNGFLAAGLLWGLSLGAAGTQIQVFFLLCVLIAGVYGALTASRKILYVQALPALIALVLRWLG